MPRGHRKCFESCQMSLSPRPTSGMLWRMEVHRWIVKECFRVNPSPPPFPDTRKVYATVVRRADHLVRKDGGVYDPDDFMANPGEYISTFAEKVGQSITPHWSI